MAILLAIAGGGAEAWASVLYLAIYGVGFGAVWLGLRHALSTAIVCSDTCISLVRGGRLIWRLNWDKVTDWRRSLDESGNLRAIELRCSERGVRRIEMGWIGLPGESYGDLLAELRGRIGRDEDAPLTARSRPSPLLIGVFVLLLVALLVSIAIGLRHW